MSAQPWTTDDLADAEGDARGFNAGLRDELLSYAEECEREGTELLARVRVLNDEAERARTAIRALGGNGK